MGKHRKKAIAGIILIVLVLAAVGIYVKLTGSSTTPAILYIESGVVEINQGNGWQAAEHGMELRDGDSVRTLQGTATIVFFEGEITRLSENTEIQINTMKDDQISLSQENGGTWSRVTKLTGTRTYEVQTPTSVATVRGTSFRMDADQGEMFVGDGVVRLRARETNVERDVGELQKVRFSATGISAIDLTEEDRKEVIRQIKGDIETLRQLRLREIRKHDFVLQQMQRRHGFSDPEMIEFLNKLDRSDVNLDSVAAKIPVEAESVIKARKLTEKIRLLHKRLNELER